MPLPSVFVYYLHITLLRLKIKNSSMKNNHQNDIICFRKIYNKISSFDWKKNIEDSLRDGLIIATGATGIFFRLKAANVKPTKASLDAMDIMKLAGGICGGVLAKDYAVYKTWINAKCDKDFMAPPGAMNLLFQHSKA